MFLCSATTPENLCLVRGTETLCLRFPNPLPPPRVGWCGRHPPRSAGGFWVAQCLRQSRTPSPQPTKAPRNSRCERRRHCTVSDRWGCDYPTVSPGTSAAHWLRPVWEASVPYTTAHHKPQSRAIAICSRAVLIHRHATAPRSSAVSRCISTAPLVWIYKPPTRHAAHSTPNI